MMRLALVVLVVCCEETVVARAARLWTRLRCWLRLSKWAIFSNFCFKRKGKEGGAKECGRGKNVSLAYSKGARGRGYQSTQARQSNNNALAFLLAD